MVILPIILYQLSQWVSLGIQPQHNFLYITLLISIINYISRHTIVCRAAQEPGAPHCGYITGRIQIQKEVISNQNSQAVKKGAAPKKAMVKKDVKSKVAAKRWL